MIFCIIKYAWKYLVGCKFGCEDCMKQVPYFWQCPFCEAGGKFISLFRSIYERLLKLKTIAIPDQIMEFFFS